MRLTGKRNLWKFAVAALLVITAILVIGIRQSGRVTDEPLVPLAEQRYGIHSLGSWSANLYVHVMNPDGVSMTQGMTYDLRFDDSCVVLNGGELRAVAQRGSRVLVTLDRAFLWPNGTSHPACPPTTLFWLDESKFLATEQEHQRVRAYQKRMGKEKKSIRTLLNTNVR